MPEKNFSSDHNVVMTKDQLTSSLTNAIEVEDEQALKQIISTIHYADLADYINFASPDQRESIVTVCGTQLDPRILLEFEPDVLNSLIKLFDKKQLSFLVTKLSVQELVSLLEHFNTDQQEEILSYFVQEKRNAILRGLSYPKDSAGAMMHDKYISASYESTVGEVLQYLIDNHDIPENFDEVFILDEEGKPIGKVYINSLIRAKRTAKVKNLMSTELQLVDAMLDQEEVSYVFRHYDLSSAPVVDTNQVMVGVILVDQILEVIEEEAEEDLMRLGGVKITDLYSAFFKTAVTRFPWLFFNLLTACLTSIVVSGFKSQIEQLVILAAIMPIVGSMGGNAGTQSVTVAVRAIANKDIATANIFHVVFKEIAACALNGLVLGLIGGLILFVLYGDINICGIFLLAVTMNFILAGLCGGLIPISIDRMGLDPAIASGVLLTFLTDFLGFFIFLSLASAFLL